MKTKVIQVSDNLMVDVWPDSGPDEPALVRIVDVGQERDNPEAGSVIVYLHELKGLVAALTEAGVMLADQAGRP